MIKKLIWLVLAINLVYVSMGVAKYGSQHVDAYGIWLLKAKAWVAEGGVPLKLLKDPAYSYSHQQYPVLLPAMMVGWIRLTGGLESFLWLYPLIYSLIIFVLYTLLRLEGMTKNQALAWAAAASFMGPLMAQGGRLHAGLADIWIAWLTGMTVLAAKKNNLPAVVVGIMVASMIKMEGLFLMVVLVTMRRPVWEKIIGMIVALVPFGWWQGQVKAWGIVSDIQFFWPGIGEGLHRVGLVVVGVVREMLKWRNWYIVWPLFWLTVPRRGKLDAASWWLLGCSCGYLGVYLLAQTETAAYVASSVDRIMLQLLPIWWVKLATRVNREVFVLG